MDLRSFSGMHFKFIFNSIFIYFRKYLETQDFYKLLFEMGNIYLNISPAINIIDDELLEDIFYYMRQCMIIPENGTVSDSMAQMFFDNQGPELVLKVLLRCGGACKDNINKFFYFTPLIPFGLTANGKAWLMENYHKILWVGSCNRTCEDIKEKEEVRDSTEDDLRNLSLLWEKFKQMFNNVQSSQSSKHLKQLLASEKAEKEAARRKEKKRQKQRNRKANHKEEPCPMDTEKENNLVGQHPCLNPGEGRVDADGSVDESFEKVGKKRDKKNKQKIKESTLLDDIPEITAEKKDCVTINVSNIVKFKKAGRDDKKDLPCRRKENKNSSRAKQLYDARQLKKVGESDKGTLKDQSQMENQNDTFNTVQPGEAEFEGNTCNVSQSGQSENEIKLSKINDSDGQVIHDQGDEAKTCKKATKNGHNDCKTCEEKLRLTPINEEISPTDTLDEEEIQKAFDLLFDSDVENETGEETCTKVLPYRSISDPEILIRKSTIRKSIIAIRKSLRNESKNITTSRPEEKMSSKISTEKVSNCPKNMTSKESKEDLINDTKEKVDTKALALKSKSEHNNLTKMKGTKNESTRVQVMISGPLEQDKVQKETAGIMSSKPVTVETRTEHSNSKKKSKENKSKSVKNITLEKDKVKNETALKMSTKLEYLRKQSSGNESGSDISEIKGNTKELLIDDDKRSFISEVTLNDATCKTKTGTRDTTTSQIEKSLQQAKPVEGSHSQSGKYQTNTSTKQQVVCNYLTDGKGKGDFEVHQDKQTNMSNLQNEVDNKDPFISESIETPQFTDKPLVTLQTGDDELFGHSDDANSTTEKGNFTLIDGIGKYTSVNSNDPVDHNTKKVKFAERNDVFEYSPMSSCNSNSSSIEELRSVFDSNKNEDNVDQLPEFFRDIPTSSMFFTPIEKPDMPMNSAGYESTIKDLEELNTNLFEGENQTKDLEELNTNLLDGGNQTKDLEKLNTNSLDGRNQTKDEEELNTNSLDSRNQTKDLEKLNSNLLDGRNQTKDLEELNTNNLLVDRNQSTPKGVLNNSVTVFNTINCNYNEPQEKKSSTEKIQHLCDKFNPTENKFSLNFIQQNFCSPTKEFGIKKTALELIPDRYNVPQDESSPCAKFEHDPDPLLDDHPYYNKYIGWIKSSYLDDSGFFEGVDDFTKLLYLQRKQNLPESKESEAYGYDMHWNPFEQDRKNKLMHKKLGKYTTTDFISFTMPII